MYTIMENQSKPKKATKRKQPQESKSEPKTKNIKLTDSSKKSSFAHKNRTKKKSKAVKINPLDIKLHEKINSPSPGTSPSPRNSPSPRLSPSPKMIPSPKRTPSPMKLKVIMEEKRNKFPILENKELIDKFMKVPMTNNQKDYKIRSPRLSRSPKMSPKRCPSPVKLKIRKEEKQNKYPILENKEMIIKCMKVPMNNNQKGRIRQALKTQLQSSNDYLYPDIINGKIQSIMKNPVLNDSDLRRIRILYNMLKTSLDKKPEAPEKVKKKKGNKEKKTELKEGTTKMEGEKELVKKVKGPKRYVVFLGNLPLDVTKDKIMSHFSEFNEHIKDIRLQKPTAGKKSAFAYVELGNEPSYELALSKHHSMMGNKRINVLYTTQKNSKISKADAKGKSAKLIALQKSGKLLGSVPMAKKRSHRRKILKKARAKEEAMKT